MVRMRFPQPRFMNINPVIFSYNKDYSRITPESFHKIEIERFDGLGSAQGLALPCLRTVEYDTARIMEKRKLETSWREVHHVRLDKMFDFKPGDSVGLLCPNGDVLVDEIMEILGIGDFFCKIERTGGIPFSYVGMVREFFKHYFDFTSLPRKSLLFKLSRSCGEMSRRHIEYLCSREGKRDYLMIGVRWNNIIDIIRTFGCNPTLEELVGECEIVKPRYFSLTNKIGTESEILVGTTSKMFDGFVRYGHVSDCLINTRREEIKVCLRANLLFRMSYDNRRMMGICTGTGIAPFISFVSNLQPHQRIWILYGFRNDEDDMSGMMAPSERVVISKVKSSDGVYVTDHLMANIGDAREYINEECVVYVCGRMEMQRKVFEIFRNEFPDVVRTKRLVFDQWS